MEDRDERNDVRLVAVEKRDRMDMNAKRVVLMDVGHITTITT